MKVLLVEPFCTGSHQRWAEGFQRHSHHQVELLTLPGRHWKWRMHGGAVSLARQARTLSFKPDVIMVTDMLDLSTFLALGRRANPSVPVVLYMHENQLTYPWSPEDEDVSRQRDRHYGFINYSSALIADEIWFNSSYHKESFLEALPDFLRAFPDYREPTTVGEIAAKSIVMPLGLEMEIQESAVGSQQSAIGTGPVEGIPLLLWNHRWEYDKGPELFFETLIELAEEGYDFQLAVLGESYGRKPRIFHRAKEILDNRIVQWGFTESRDEYNDWLMRADIVPVTSWHDFFGASVVEAIGAGCYPLLPKRLAYPEHVPAECLYEDGQFKARLVDLLNRFNWLRKQNPAAWVQHYQWKQLAAKYDRRIAEVAEHQFASAPNEGPMDWH